MIATLSQDLSQPEYIHVLINPFPVYGLAIAVIGLIIALIQRTGRRRSRPSRSFCSAARSRGQSCISEKRATTACSPWLMIRDKRG